MNGRKKNITLIFSNDFDNVHLGKDVFLVPYYLGKRFDMDVNIVYTATKANKNLPSEIRNVKLIPKRNIFFKSSSELLRGIHEIIYVFFNAKKIDFLMRFFFSNITAITGFLYKKINKNGILYIKSDARPGEWPLLGYYNSINKNTFLCKPMKYLYRTFLENTDLITIETKIGYDAFFTNNLLDINFKSKAKLMFSGFDKDLFEKLNIKLKAFDEKENIILIVGRLGSYPKNTEMLLEAAAKLSLNDWKIVLIGPIEKNEQDFQKRIDMFYTANPQLRDRVVFTGPIYDKKELWTWYNNAKMFVLTSLHESFSIVLIESLFFKNYILSTDVGAAKEIIEMGYGEIIPQNDALYLSMTIQKIINEDTLTKLYDKVDWDKVNVSWEHYINEAVKDLWLI